MKCIKANRLTIPLMILIANALTSSAIAKGRRRTPKNIKVAPEITYRQAYLEQNEGSVFHRESDRNFADQLYLSLKLVRQYRYIHELVLEPAFYTERNNPTEKNFRIDQGYIKTQISQLSLHAGKRTQYEGSGFFVNPSDLLNEEKDYFDPLAQREGRVFSRLDWQSDDWSTGLGYIPARGQDAKEGRFWYHLTSDILESDFRVQYTYNHVDLSTLGLSLARFFGDTIEFHFDGRWQQKQRDSSRQPARVIFECEKVDLVANAANIKGEPHPVECLDPQSKNSTSIVLGSRLVLSAKRTLVMESIQDQTGLTREEQKTFYYYTEQNARFNNTDPTPLSQTIGRQYLFLSYQDEESIEKTMFNSSILYNLADQSAFGSLEMRYAFSPITNIGIVPTAFWGNPESEFGESPFKQVSYLIFRGRF